MASQFRMDFKSNIALRNKSMGLFLGQTTRRINVINEFRIKWKRHQPKLAFEEISFYRRLKVVLLQLYICTRCNSRRSGFGCHAPMVNTVKKHLGHSMFAEFTFVFQNATKSHYTNSLSYRYIVLVDNSVRINSIWWASQMSGVDLVGLWSLGIDGEFEFQLDVECARARPWTKHRLWRHPRSPCDRKSLSPRESHH